jgi:hypothetical protein
MMVFSILVFFGKEETNKDFMEHLVEDEDSLNSVGVADIQDDQIEQGIDGKKTAGGTDPSV